MRYVHDDGAWGYGPYDNSQGSQWIQKVLAQLVEQIKLAVEGQNPLVLRAALGLFWSIRWEFFNMINSDVILAVAGEAAKKLEGYLQEIERGGLEDKADLKNWIVSDLRCLNGLKDNYRANVAIAKAAKALAPASPR